MYIDFKLLLAHYISFKTCRVHLDSNSFFFIADGLLRTLIGNMTNSNNFTNVSVEKNRRHSMYFTIREKSLEIAKVTRVDISINHVVAVGSYFKPYFRLLISVW